MPGRRSTAGDQVQDHGRRGDRAQRGPGARVRAGGDASLGEYIIQLAKEPPSHIIAPAVHKTRAEITRLFDEHHHQRFDGPLRPAPELVAEARKVLREKFLSADVGISGANFLIADTGTVTLVTNEGNADLGTTRPRVHIVIAGIEKLVPGTDEASVMLRARAQRHRPGDQRLYQLPHRRQAPRGPGWPGRSTTWCCWTTAAPACSAMSSAPCCAASVAGRA
ncbi:MAG: LUD domain-containing protein [Arhodomonas sp.]|nr:LUD domain-containing protein [Arhodomonas sp.]